MKDPAKYLLSQRTIGARLDGATFPILLTSADMRSWVKCTQHSESLSSVFSQALSNKMRTAACVSSAYHNVHPKRPSTKWTQPLIQVFELILPETREANSRKS